MVGSELEAMRQPLDEVVDEVIRSPAVSRSDEPARHKLRVGVDRYPRPHIAPSVFLLLTGDVLFLRTTERPDFVALDAAAGEVAESFVLIVGARRAEIDQKLIYCGAMHACHARDSTNGIPSISAATTRVRSSVLSLFMRSK
jgi:hypothetical protein